MKQNIELTRKEQVLNGAKSCIVKNGLSNISIKDVAEESQVSTGIIYYYFKNKEDVLLQVLKESFRQSHEKVMETVEPLKTSSEKLKKHLENINSVPKDNFEFYPILLNYLGEATHNDEVKKIVNKFFKNLNNYTEEYLYENIKDQSEVKKLSVMIYALGLGLGIMWSMDNKLYDLDEMDQSVKNLIFSYVSL